MVLVTALVLGACGGSEATREFSELAASGREIVLTRGCAACHGDDGAGDVGPSWQGLFGSVVQLEQGGSVVADAEYLRRAIVEPDAEIVAGSSISMPVTNLSEAEVEAVVAFIEELQ